MIAAAGIVKIVPLEFVSVTGVVMVVGAVSVARLSIATFV